MPVPCRQVDLDEAITAERLRGNCRFCESSGTEFVPRPVCSKCKRECVELLAGQRITIGKTCWRDLLGLKLKCYNCDRDALERGDNVARDVRRLPSFSLPVHLAGRGIAVVQWVARCCESAVLLLPCAPWCHQCDIGFLCTHVEGGFVCPTRDSSRGQRKVRHGTSNRH